CRFCSLRSGGATAVTSVRMSPTSSFRFFFFNDTATTEIYTLSLHDALPISFWFFQPNQRSPEVPYCSTKFRRSEEHTSELQSLAYLVCRLLLEKKKQRH